MYQQRKVAFVKDFKGWNKVDEETIRYVDPPRTGRFSSPKRTQFPVTKSLRAMSRHGRVENWPGTLLGLDSGLGRDKNRRAELVWVLQCHATRCAGEKKKKLELSRSCKAGGNVSEVLVRARCHVNAIRHGLIASRSIINHSKLICARWLSRAR